MQRMEENHGLSNIQSNFEERKPQIRIAVDRARAADLGVSLQTVGRTLETVLGSRIVTTFIERDREYNVILQGRAEDRATPADLDSIYVRSDRTDELIPLSNLVRLTETAGATSRMAASIEPMSRPSPACRRPPPRRSSTGCRVRSRRASVTIPRSVDANSNRRPGARTM